MHAGHSKLMAIYATWVWDDGYSRVVLREIVTSDDLPEEVVKGCKELYDGIAGIVRDAVQGAVKSSQIRKDVDVDRAAAKAMVMMTGIFTSRHFFETKQEAKRYLGGLLVDWATSLR